MTTTTSTGTDDDRPWMFREVDVADATTLVAMMDATDRWDAVRAARSWVLDRAMADPSAAQAGLVLDVGCGPGTFTAAARRRGRTTMDVDRSVAMIRAARSRHHGAPGVVADVHGLPFADAAAGLVHCERVLQWTDHPPAAIAELWRVTAPGGQLVLTDTDWGTLAVDDPDDPDGAGAAALAAAALGWVPHPLLARSLARRLTELSAHHVEVRTDTVQLAHWDPDDPAQTDGPPGLPLHSIAAGAPAADRPAAVHAVEAIAQRARGGGFSASLTILTAVGRRRSVTAALDQG